MQQPCQWISIRDAQASLKCSRKELNRMVDGGKIICREADKIKEYRLESLPLDAQENYWRLYRPLSKSVDDSDIYAKAPGYSRRKADKYIQLFNAAAGLSGNALKTFIAEWNHTHPDFKTSYSRLLTERKAYNTHGISALLGKWGKRSCRTSVPDNLYAYFKSLYLHDGRPSAMSCWEMTLGYAVQNHIDPESVPSHTAFVRRLKSETPEQAIYTAREGAAAANKRYGFYLKRDYKDILSGECWVSDHAQIDVACTCEINGKTRVLYPWVTAWRDFKSGIWTGWDVHAEAPNSDHIFLSFYRGAVKYGIPLNLYLDNGKDYRCRDFAGGRKYHRLDVDEGKMISITGALGIQTTFAKPYNAQAKPIERDFNRNKELFSKHYDAYRGGNVVERPENHNKSISSGKAMHIDDISAIFDQFVNDIIMQSLVSSGWRKGLAPIDIWNMEYSEAIAAQKVRQVSTQALMLFCTRVSGVLTISRRGVHDCKLGIDYYADWMEGQRGRKVYLRRDVKAMQEAWVFDSATDEYIGNAWLLPEVGALVKTDIDKSTLQEHLALKRNSNNLIKIMSSPDSVIPFTEKMHVLATAKRVLRTSEGLLTGQQPKRYNGPLLFTDMDKAIAKHEKNLKFGKTDLSIFDDHINEAVDRIGKDDLTVWDDDIDIGATA